MKNQYFLISNHRPVLLIKSIDIFKGLELCITIQANNANMFIVVVETVLVDRR
jgi:hypothetical protein